MPSKSNPRNHRNNPYMLDELFGNVHRSAAGVLWRYRTETLIAITTGTAIWSLSRILAIAWALVAVGTITAALLLVPVTRRFVIRRAWCVLSRHRLQRVFYETRMHTRSGRVPFVLRIHPTEVGERAHIWCRAGICFEDFEAHTGEIAAACYARESRVARSKRWAQLITVDIVRRDTLAASNVVKPGVASTRVVRPVKPGPDLDIAP